MLLGDFKTYISSEINKDIVQSRATLLPQEFVNSLEDLEIEQLTSVIYGLLRQNSYTFLEVLEDASIAAIKATFRDVAKVNFYKFSSQIMLLLNSFSVNFSNCLPPRIRMSH